MNEIYTERHASAANLSDVLERVFSGNERKTFTTAAHTDKHTHTLERLAKTVFKWQKDR